MATEKASKKHVSDPWIVSKHSTREGSEYHLAFQRALQNGNILPDDPRVQLDVVTAGFGFAGDDTNFLGLATRAVEKLSSWSSQYGQERSYDSTIAAQRKLIHQVAASRGEIRTKSIGDYAACVELAALRLSNDTGPRSLVRRMLGLAIEGADRAVFRERHKNWTGVVASVAIENTLTTRVAGFGLLRAGLLESDDIRLTASARSISEANSMRTSDFLQRVNEVYWGNLGKLHSGNDETYSREAILRDIGNLRRRANGHDDEVEKQRGQAWFMSVMGCVGERMALNIASQSLATSPTPLVSTLLATSASSVDRANTYESRAKKLEQERAGDKIVPFKRRDHGPAME